MTITPPDWAGYELLVMRLLLVLALLYRGGLPKVIRFRVQSHPIGLARVLDLTFLGGELYPKLWRGAYVAAAFYVTGVLAPVGIAYLAILTLLAVTYVNSQGGVNHGLYLTLVVLMAQLLAGVLDPLLRALDVHPAGLLLDNTAQTAAWWSVQAIAASYFVSGITKVARTGFRWVGEASRLAMVMVVRTEISNQDMPGSVPPEEAERRTRLATWLSVHRLAGGLLFAGGLWVELLAPVTLINRWTLLLGGLALIGLHRAIGQVLLLPFKLYQIVVLIFLVNPVYLLVEALRWLGVPEALLP